MVRVGPTGLGGGPREGGLRRARASERASWVPTVLRGLVPRAACAPHQLGAWDPWILGKRGGGITRPPSRAPVGERVRDLRRCRGVLLAIRGRPAGSAGDASLPVEEGQKGRAYPAPNGDPCGDRRRHFMAEQVCGAAMFARNVTAERPRAVLRDLGCSRVGLRPDTYIASSRARVALALQRCGKAKNGNGPARCPAGAVDPVLHITCGKSDSWLQAPFGGVSLEFSKLPVPSGRWPYPSLSAASTKRSARLRKSFMDDSTMSSDASGISIARGPRCVIFTVPDRSTFRVMVIDPTP